VNKRFFGPVLLILVCAAPGFFDVCGAQAEPFSLPQALAAGTAQNRLVKIARTEEQISMADVHIARSALLPSVDAKAGQTFLSTQPRAIFDGFIVPTSEQSFYNYGLSVQQTLFDFMGNASRYGANKMVFNSKQLDTRRVRNSVGLSIAVSYFDLLETEKLAALEQKEVDRLNAHLNDARNLFEAGSITRNDLLQAEVRIADARQRLAVAQKDRELAASRLNDAMGRALTIQIEAIEPPEGKIPIAERDLQLEPAWRRAEENRPEVGVIDTTISSLGLEEKAVKSDYFPKLFVKGGYDYTQDRYVEPQGDWSLVFGVTVNVFGGGITKAQLEKLEGRKRNLYEQRERLLDEIRLEVESYIYDYRTALERMAVTKDAVGQAEENLRINRVRYEEGEGTATEVLDAVTNLREAETNLNNAFYDFKRAEAGVMYSEGMDLSEVYK
jgi:outer membrane protein TolC